MAAATTAARTNRVNAKAIAVALGAGVLAGALWWRRNPSACP